MLRVSGYIHMGSRMSAASTQAYLLKHSMTVPNKRPVPGWDVALYECPETHP